MIVSHSSRTHRHLLADNLRKLRRAQGLSQEALAEIAGLHRTFVGSVERAERNISIDNIARLATALSVSIQTLLEQE
jgi:transcriptional regulator with XRE-family HTH domain